MTTSLLAFVGLFIAELLKVVNDAEQGERVQKWTWMDPGDETGLMKKSQVVGRPRDLCQAAFVFECQYLGSWILKAMIWVRPSATDSGILGTYRGANNVTLSLVLTISGWGPTLNSKPSTLNLTPWEWRKGTTKRH